MTEVLTCFLTDCHELTHILFCYSFVVTYVPFRDTYLFTADGQLGNVNLKL